MNENLNSATLLVEGVEESDNRLLAWWHSAAGKYIVQSWHSRSVLDRTTGIINNWEDMHRVSFWEMERPYLLTGFDPNDLIRWAKEAGKYQRT